jgi:hypothetical protein
VTVCIVPNCGGWILARNRCLASYTFLKRTGYDRPADLVERNNARKALGPPKPPPDRGDESGRLRLHHLPQGTLRLPRVPEYLRGT